MLGAELRIPIVAGVMTVLPETSRWSASWNCYSSIPNISYHLSSRNRHCRKSRFMVICSKSSRGSFNQKSNQTDEPDDDYIEAAVLVSGLPSSPFLKLPFCPFCRCYMFLIINSLSKCLKRIRFFLLKFCFLINAAQLLLVSEKW